MTRGEAWSLHASNVLVVGTGAIYGWMLYFAQSSDPYALVNHRWQPLVQQLHLLVAPLLVFAAGMIFTRHVWARVRSGFQSRRRLGLALALSLLPMIASGYLLQTTVDETWTRIWVWVHVATSVLWTIGYGLHLLSPRPSAGALAD